MVAFFDPFKADFAQDVGLSFIGVVQLEYRVMVGFGDEFKLHIAAFGDCAGIGYRVRYFAEDGLHLLRTLEIELRRAEAESLGVVQRGLRLDAEHDLVGFGVFFF